MTLRMNTWVVVLVPPLAGGVVTWGRAARGRSLRPDLGPPSALPMQEVDDEEGRWWEEPRSGGGLWRRSPAPARRRRGISIRSRSGRPGCAS